MQYVPASQCARKKHPTNYSCISANVFVTKCEVQVKLLKRKELLSVKIFILAIMFCQYSNWKSENEYTSYNLQSFKNLRIAFMMEIISLVLYFSASRRKFSKICILNISDES